LSSQEAHRIDTTVPHPARRYNYWLGGKDHFQADRDSGDAIAEFFPSIRAAALANRGFMRRAVTMLTEQGIRQFLDIGTGIPAPNNTHEVAQAIAPDARVVYVDNDPIVMSHARALLASGPAGQTAYIEADLRDYERILSHPDLLATIDLSQPVAVLLVAILHFVTDEDDPRAIVSGLVSRLAPGSYLVLSHGTMEFSPLPRTEDLVPKAKHGSLRFRNKAELTELLAGLEILEPGIVPISQWRIGDEPGPHLTAEEAGIYGVVARVP
jgi:S-adenosyl methyltransferase